MHIGPEERRSGYQTISHLDVAAELASSALCRGPCYDKIDLLRSLTVVDFDSAGSLTKAAAGDQRAWDAIVDRYSDLVWAVARSFRLTGADAADVTQATWLRLVEHLGELRDGGRLDAWLVTTARREALQMLRRGQRDIPTEDIGLSNTDWVSDGPPEHVLRSEQESMLWSAFHRLPAACQRLLRVLLTDPAPSYAEVGAALEMPIGSIGPTRARCLASLRGMLVD
jgi:RNA polymerase sigma factor (sigma-70 family)